MATNKYLKTAALFSATVSILLLASDSPALIRADGAAKDLTSAYNAFGIDLYKKLASSAGPCNTLVSPVSVALALAVADNGSAGDTEREIAAVLNLQGIDETQRNLANESLIRKLREAEPAVELSVANSLWLGEGFDFREEFIQRSMKHFGAQVSTGIDPAMINRWVKENTKDRIDRIVDALPPGTVSVIVNAIYFKGLWARAFDRSDTETEEFYLPDGTVKKFPMMKQGGKYLYAETEGFRAVRLPYREERICMYVFLPRRKTGLAELHGELTGENWKKWISLLTMREGRVVLPRFKVEFGTSLKPVLTELGMKLPFSRSRADFSKMCTISGENVYIEDVVHKTFIEVNEEGTEAAAATGVTMSLTSVTAKEEPFEMIVDRPFLVAVSDLDTGLILFLGSVFDPEEQAFRDR